MASIRYRFLHVALGLRRLGVTSTASTDPKSLLKNLANLDALVVVKRLDAQVLDIASAAADLGIPIFLDVCDDILCAEYRAGSRQLHRSVLRGVLPLIDAIVTTGAAMSERIRSYGFDVPEIVEVPDVAETRQALAEVMVFAAWLKNPSASPAGPANGATRGLAQATSATNGHRANS